MLKNITFSAEEELIQKAREKAFEEKTSLNIVFRKWLTQYAENEIITDKYDKIKGSLDHVLSGRRFTRDEMNER